MCIEECAQLNCQSSHKIYGSKIWELPFPQSKIRVWLTRESVQRSRRCGVGRGSGNRSSTYGFYHRNWRRLKLVLSSIARDPSKTAANRRFDGRSSYYFRQNVARPLSRPGPGATQRRNRLPVVASSGGAAAAKCEAVPTRRFGAG